MTHEDDVTREQTLPPHETTESPVEVTMAMPRYFGVTPPTLLFGIATATLAIAITLAILSHWIAALVLAVLVLVELLVFVGLARRKPDTVVAKASVRALDRGRDRVAWIVRSASVRTEASRKVTRLRHELLELDARRERGLRDLGAAVLDENDEAVASARAAVGAIDEESATKQAEMRAIENAAREHLERGRLHVQSTVIKPPAEDESRSPSGS